MKIYMLLFLEFFKIGLFSVGGGYATIPFLYQIVNDYGWYTSQQLSDMIAISTLTPGPVGINMATFAGFKTASFSGAIFASIALILPSYILVVAISGILKKYKENFYVKAVLASLKPAGCGLLTVVGLNLIKDNVNNLIGVGLLLFLFALSFRFKKNPLYYFLIGGLFGIFIHFLLPNTGI